MSDYLFESTPEDAWDAGDSIVEMVLNLFHRCALLDHGPRSPPIDLTVRELMNQLVTRVRLRMLGDDLDVDDQVRADLILDDVQFIRSRYGDD